MCEEKEERTRGKERRSFVKKIGRREEKMCEKKEDRKKKTC